MSPNMCKRRKFLWFSWGCSKGDKILPGDWQIAQLEECLLQLQDLPPDPHPNSVCHRQISTVNLIYPKMVPGWFNMF